MEAAAAAGEGVVVGCGAVRRLSVGHVRALSESLERRAVAVAISSSWTTLWVVAQTAARAIVNRDVSLA